MEPAPGEVAAEFAAGSLADAADGSGVEDAAPDDAAKPSSRPSAERPGSRPSAKPGSRPSAGKAGSRPSAETGSEPSAEQPDARELDDEPAGTREAGPAVAKRETGSAGTKREAGPAVASSRPRAAGERGETESTPRDSGESRDLGEEPARVPGAEDDSPGSPKPPPRNGAGRSALRDADSDRVTDRADERREPAARRSPFPPPYSRRSPEPEPEPDFWQERVTPAASEGGLPGLIAHPITKIILITLPALVVVAVVAALLGMRDAQNDARGSQPGGTGATSAPATSAPDDSRSEDAKPTASEPPKSAEPTPAASSPGSSPTASERPTAGAADPPEGWRRYKDPTGFSVALPKGWDVSQRNGTQVFFRGPERSTFLLIDQTSSPKSNAKKDWLAQEKTGRSRFSGYKRVRIEAVDYFKTAADWEWTYNSGGTRLHVINRGFVTGKKHGYAIYWSTPDKRWKENLHYFRTFTATFQPAK